MNPLFRNTANTAQSGGNVLSAFKDFKNKHNGNKDAMLQELMQIGNVNQSQLNEIVKVAGQLKGALRK